jgi:hypothetical protein
LDDLKFAEVIARSTSDICGWREGGEEGRRGEGAERRGGKTRE